MHFKIQVISEQLYLHIYVSTTAGATLLCLLTVCTLVNQTLHSTITDTVKMVIITAHNMPRDTLK